MSPMLFALLLLPMLPPDVAPAGNPEAGKAAWNSRMCRMCHGEQAEGGYGPDLAGRALTFAQFKHAVRTPWGVMPAFTERQVSDQTLADITAYLMSLPKVPEPAPWRFPTPPPDTPRGQTLLITNGCAQCHEPELRAPRMALGGEAAEVNFEYFANRVYQHTDFYPDGRMGNFSRLRLQESTLREVYDFAVRDLGLLPAIAATIPPGVSAGGNMTYTLTVKNQGVKGKGLTAEDVTVSLALGPGSSLLSATGGDYQGVRRDAQSNSDVAVWHIARLAPEEQQTYTVILSGAGAAPGQVFKGSLVRWTKPEMRQAFPNLAIRDSRMPGKDPQTFVAFPPSAQPPR